MHSGAWESLDSSISLITSVGTVTRCREILKYWGWDRKHSCLFSGRILIFIIFRPEIKNIIQETILGKRHSVHFSFYVQKGKFKIPRNIHVVRTKILTVLSLSIQDHISFLIYSDLCYGLQQRFGFSLNNSHTLPRFIFWCVIA